MRWSCLSGCAGALRETFATADIIGQLDDIEGLVKAGNTYAALKRIRDLYPQGRGDDGIHCTDTWPFEHQ